MFVLRHSNSISAILSQWYDIWESLSLHFPPTQGIFNLLYHIGMGRAVAWGIELCMLVSQCVIRIRQRPTMVPPGLDCSQLPKPPASTELNPLSVHPRPWRPLLLFKPTTAAIRHLTTEPPTSPALLSHPPIPTFKKTDCRVECLKYLWLMDLDRWTKFEAFDLKACKVIYMCTPVEEKGATIVVI